MEYAAALADEKLDKAGEAFPSESPPVAMANIT